MELRWLNLALSWLTQHKFAELLALNLAIYLICQLANVLTQYGLFSKLFCVVFFDTLELSLVRQLRLIYDWFNLILEFLHNIFVLQLRDIHLFTLHICVEK